ncbi:cytoskeletal protein binding protein [Umbelopsis sp. WA50703]
MKYVAVCRALYDYDAQESEEVSMKEGDVIYVVDNSDPSWLEVQLKMPSVDQIGPVGLVPANYVEEVQPIGTVRAEYAYEAQQDEEVSFEEDEIMTLYEKDDADWYLVQLQSGVIGLAPSNYTKEVDPHEEQPNRNERRVEEQVSLPISPPAPTASSPSLVNDDAKTWSVQEYNPEKKKKKKGKGTLTVGNSMISYESETDKSAPLQQYHVLDISKYLLDNKNVHIEISSEHPTVLDFQAASKSEAKAILVKITDSRTAAAKYENSQRPASAHNQPSVTDSVDVPQSFSCEPKWGIVLYNFEADGGNEMSVRQHDQVLITDYSSGAEWWHIETSDQRSGIVPSSYLQFHEDYEAALAKENGQEEADKRQQEEKRIKAEEERRNLEERQRKQQEEEAARRYEETKKAEEINRRREEEVRRRQEEEQRRQEEEQQREIERKKKAERSASRQELTLPNPTKVRWWTDRSGAFRVEAQFLSASGGKYRLHKVNGVKIDVPEDKLCVADVEFVRNLLSKQRGEKSNSKSSNNKTTSTSSKASVPPSKTYNQDWDWFDWFMMIGIPMQQALIYSSAFKEDKLDDKDLPKLTHKQMKTLGLKENHVRRIERYIENEHVEPPSGDENENEEEDEQLARRVKEAEASGSAPNIFRKRSKSSDSSGKPRPTPTTSAPSKVHGDIFDLLTGEPVAEEPELQLARPNVTGDSTKEATSPVKEVISPKGSQDGFDDDAWIPRTVQAIKTGTYKPKNPPAMQQHSSTSGSQQSIAAQPPEQMANNTGQSQNYQQQQQQQQQSQSSQQQQMVYQKAQPVQQQLQGSFQQQPVQQSFTGYQQQPNQGVNAPQLTGVQGPVGLQQEYQQPQSTAQYAQYASEATGPQQQYQQPQQPQVPQFVPQPTSNMQFQHQQTTGIPVQTQFIPQQPTNLQYQQQQPQMAMSNPSQFVPQQLTGIQFQQQQQMPMQNQQPIQQSFSQPIQATTVPLSNILPPPLVPQSSAYGGGMQPQQTGNRSWQTATAQNPFGSPTPAPLAPQLTGVQFSTPSPETFAGNHHMSAISPQYTGLNAQQPGFGNTFNGNLNNRGFGQPSGYQQPYAAANGFNQANQFGRGW